MRVPIRKKYTWSFADRVYFALYCLGLVGVAAGLVAVVLL